MWNHNIPLSPADLAKPMIILANSKPSGGPGTRGTRRSWEFGENGGIPRNSCHFSKFHQKAPGTAFLVKILPETHFWCP